MAKSNFDSKPPWNNLFLSSQLRTASYSGQDTEVLDLLKRGINPDCHGYYPLHRACEYSYPHIAVTLIQWGADLRRRDRAFGKTPLHEACSHRYNMACVRVLLEHHSPTDIKDNKRRTPVDLARQYKHYEVADFVTNYKPLARGPLSGYPSIKQLSEYQVNKWHELGVHFHLSESQMVHIRSSEYPSTETFLAAKVKRMKLNWKDILEALLSIGEYEVADRVCSERGEDQTVLSVCTYYCWKDFIKHFADAEGFNPREPVNDAGDSVLSIACTRGHVSVIDYLAKDKGCELDGPVNAAGDTLRSLAESNGLFEVIKYLHDPSAYSTDTPLSQEETDALKVVLSGSGVKPGEVSLEDSQSTLERVQQLLVEKGYKDLATNLIVKLSEVIQLQKQYLQRLDSLMTDEDKIDLCYLKVLLVGPPGVGKTTTLNRLLKAFENIRTAGDKAKRRSTLLANCTQVLAFVGQDEAADWLSSSIGDNDEEAILLVRYLCGEELEEPVEPVYSGETREQKMAHTNTEDVPTQRNLAQENSASDLRSDTPGSETDETPETASQEDETPPLQFHAKERVSKVLVSKKKPQHLQMVKERLRKLVRGGNYTKAISHLGNTLLNINDIGGQPGFLEMLPALSTGPAMYLVFLDLSKELDQLYEITFDRDNTVITPFKSLHTVESTISQILSSIASAHSISRDSVSIDLQKVAQFGEKFRSFQEIQPVAALIGTHLDKLENREEKIRETNESLKQVTGKFKKILVAPPTSVETSSSTSLEMSSPFFSVDNYDGKEAVDIAPIRNFMNKVFATHFQGASLPIRKKWLIFNIILRREYRIVKLSDCFEIANMLGIDKEEMKFCLWYLDCIGTLMYYANIADDEDGWFENHVICSPQVIFDSISQLIVSSLRTLHTSDTVTNYEQEELIKKGQFSIESITKHCKNVENKELIPAKQLIQLLKHVNLLSPIIHKEADGDRITYLMPAVLDSATQDELTAHPPPDADNPEPLLITFKCGYVPTGTFCALITQLVSCGPNGILDFVWDLVEDGVKRNLVSFYVDYVNKVTLICHDRCYEVRVKCNDPDISLHELCAHVLSAILHILRDLYEKLSPEIAFRCLCPKHKRSQTLSNLCTLGDTKKLRFFCEGQPVKVKDSQHYWIGPYISQFFLNSTKHTFRDSSHQQGDLCLKEVKKVTHHTRSKWFHLGIELDFDVGALKGIRKRNNFVVDDCFTEMFSRWLKRSTPPPSWSELKDALNSPVIGRGDIAKEITADIRIPAIAANTTVQGANALKSLERIMWDTRSKWRLLGSELGIDNETLKTIEITNHHVVNDCFTEMLSHWLKHFTSGPTKLVKALNSPAIGCGDIAKEITGDIKKLIAAAATTAAQGTYNLKSLQLMMWDTRAKWRLLGSELGVDIETLNVIERTNRYVVDDCFTEMISHWLKHSTSDYESLKNKLVEALKSPVIGRGDIVKKIEASKQN